MFADTRCVHVQEKDDRIEDLEQELYLEELQTKSASFCVDTICLLTCVVSTSRRRTRRLRT